MPGFPLQRFVRDCAATLKKGAGYTHPRKTYKLSVDVSTRERLSIAGTLFIENARRIWKASFAHVETFQVCWTAVGTRGLLAGDKRVVHPKMS